MSKEAFTSFNKTYFSFLEFIKLYLKNDANFKKFYRKNQIVKETNVKLIITMWNNRITTKYYTQVMNKDFEFFLNKSYGDEMTGQEKETPLLKYINDFKDIYEYICVFYHAKNIIVSYGGVACTNRFFCNPNANVILIANLHYKSEYDSNNENQMYSHIRLSHIYICKTQSVLLDFENHIDINNIDSIINLLK
jgi:hypothetical protein